MTQEQKMDLILEKVTGMEWELKELKTDVAQLKADVAELKTDVAQLKTDVAELKTDVAQLKTDVAELKADVAILKVNVDDLKRRMRRVELTQENEVKRKISMVAEGHSILNRKLDEALIRDEDEETYRLRVVRMENRWEKLRQAVNC